MLPSIQIGTGEPALSSVDVVLVCVHEESLKKSPWLAGVDRALGGGLFAHAKQVEFEGKLEQTLDVPTLGRIGARRVVLIGLGPRDDIDAARLRGAVATAVRCAFGVGKIGRA